MEVINMMPEVMMKEVKRKEGLELLSVDYRIQKASFSQRINCQINLNGITCVFGDSGCGKTTLLRALAGFEQHFVKEHNNRITFGSLTWFSDSTFLPTEKRRVACVFQDATLFPHLNAELNLLFGYQLANRVPADVNPEIKPDEVINTLELSNLLHLNTEQLSGGEKQRIALGRALLAKPNLLLLDEPFSALDQKNKLTLSAKLKSLLRKYKIPAIYISHDLLEVAELADDLLILKKERQHSQIDYHGPFLKALTDLSQKITQADNAFSVLSCQLATEQTDEHLTQLSLGEQYLFVPKLPEHLDSNIKVTLQARDISLSLVKPLQTSILNILSGEIIEIGVVNSKGQCLIKLIVEQQEVLVRISARSLNQLALTKGLFIYLQIKAVALVDKVL